MTLSTVDLNLPWSCVENGTAIVDADGAPAAYGLSLDETPAIVRAVNNHEALVRAVRELTFDATANATADMVRFGQAFDEARKLLASLE